MDQISRREFLRWIGLGALLTMLKRVSPAVDDEAREVFMMTAGDTHMGWHSSFMLDEAKLLPDTDGTLTAKDLWLPDGNPLPLPADVSRTITTPGGLFQPGDIITVFTANGIGADADRESLVVTDIEQAGFWDTLRVAPVSEHVNIGEGT